MQAQAASGGNAGGSALSNPKVQIGLIAVGVIALIVVIWLLFFNSGSGQVSSSGTLPGTPAGDVPVGMAGANGPATPGTMPIATGEIPGMAGAAPAVTPGTAPAEAPSRPQNPGVRTRGNPFRPSTEIAEALASVPDLIIPATLAQPHGLYQELYKPKPAVDSGADDGEGPPVPAMRVAGIIQGSDQLTAMIQMGDVFMTVTPGNMIPEGNPVFRVDRIEPTRVLLSRRWELGERKGVQRIEVALANGQQTTTPGLPGGGGFPRGGGNGPGGPMIGAPLQ